MRVVCLAGGVGGAKLAEGLQIELAPGELTVVVNTGDDIDLHGLTVCPDHDTVLYTLAGLADPVQGWGIDGETYEVAAQLARLGEETWFRLGDRDIATHLFRAERLQIGVRPTDVALELAARLGVQTRILPMTDVPVRTRVRTDAGWLDFQDYFVRLHQEPEVLDVRYDGVDSAAVTPEVAEAIRSAELIVVAPSNPIVSIGPILAVPGLLDEIVAARAHGTKAVGLSGIVGGRALRGPADRMLASLGHEPNALGVARVYAAAGLLDVFVIDRQDAALADTIRGLGLGVVVADTVMAGSESRAEVARVLLSAASAAVSEARP